MPNALQSLTGPWMGRFSYVTQARPAVAFNAMLQDTGGDISGETLEPNSFSVDGTDSLIAGIIGVREGSLVRWSKKYSDFDAPTIDYDGIINPTFTRIEGRWVFPLTNWNHGTFVLVRDTVTVDTATRRAKKAHAWLPAVWEIDGDNEPRKK